MNTAKYYDVGEFIKLLHSKALQLVEKLQKEGVPAVLTGKVARDILLKDYRLYHIINITVGKRDRLTVLTTRRVLNSSGLKLVGEIYLGKGILYRDEWLYSDNKYQMLIRINYMTMSNGEELPPIRSDFQLHPQVINPYQLLYEAYNELLNTPNGKDEVARDIQRLVKLIAKSDLG